MKAPFYESHERLSGSHFHDVDLRESVFADVNANLESMTIEGVLVSELFRAYRERGTR
jgi:hypothetical protein